MFEERGGGGQGERVARREPREERTGCQLSTNHVFSILPGHQHFGQRIPYVDGFIFYFPDLEQETSCFLGVLGTRKNINKAHLFKVLLGTRSLYFPGEAKKKACLGMVGALTANLDTKTQTSQKMLETLSIP